jgi:hypothetical protein
MIGSGRDMCLVVWIRSPGLWGCDRKQSDDLSWVLHTETSSGARDMRRVFPAPVVEGRQITTSWPANDNLIKAADSEPVTVPSRSGLGLLCICQTICRRGVCLPVGQ